MSRVCQARVGRLGRGIKGIIGRQKGLCKGQKEKNHSQMCTSRPLISLPNSSIFC